MPAWSGTAGFRTRLGGGMQATDLWTSCVIGFHTLRAAME